MTEEEKKIKKMSNEEKVEALAKFIALRSYDPRKAILYGYMLDCLLDEINRGEKKIQKLQKENLDTKEENKNLQGVIKNKNYIIETLEKGIEHEGKAIEEIKNIATNIRLLDLLLSNN